MCKFLFIASPDNSIAKYISIVLIADDLTEAHSLIESQGDSPSNYKIGQHSIQESGIRFTSYITTPVDVVNIEHWVKE
jgi:hypothetical protein